MSNIFNIGDKVLFSSAGDDRVQLKSETGVILKVGEGKYSILKTSTHGNYIHHAVPEIKIASLEQIEQVKMEIEEYYEDKINEYKRKLQVVTDEMKEDERIEKYSELKLQIKATAKNLLKSEDDFQFENKLKAICYLKKELYTIELDCTSEIRKHNGGVWYEIKLIESDKKMRLKNLDEETVARVFANL